MKNKIGCLAMLCLCMCLCGCSMEMFNSKLNDLEGDLIGNSFECQFYDNMGNPGMVVSGEKIKLRNNVVKSKEVGEDGKVKTNKKMSSVVSIIVDGSSVETCGDTVIFQETGLTPDVLFDSTDIESHAKGIGDNTSVAGIVNKYKNIFGKSRVVIIKSQLGVPIMAYSGKSVYYEICDDLPKTTKVMIDDRALYIHQSNFQLVDKDLLD